MTRAEEAALKAYPKEDGKVWNSAFGVFEFDRNAPQREAFQKGYEQAEKDTIEIAVKWLEEHADEYNGSESSFDHMEEEMITDFRKAMEEE